MILSAARIGMEGTMDGYTKVVLTVIALALVVIAFQNSGMLPAHAQSGELTKVEICGYWITRNKLDCASVHDGSLDVRH